MTELLYNRSLNEVFPNFWKNSHFMGHIPCKVTYKDGKEEEGCTLDVVSDMDFFSLKSITAGIHPASSIPEANCKTICNDILEMMGLDPIDASTESAATVEFVDGSHYNLKLEGYHDTVSGQLNIWIWMKNDFGESFTVSVTTQDNTNSTVCEKQLPQWEICKILLKNGVYIF